MDKENLSGFCKKVTLLFLVNKYFRCGYLFLEILTTWDKSILIVHYSYLTLNFL